ncbi:MAG: diiron oxygenase [Acidimicrobiales bacterium]
MSSSVAVRVSRLSDVSARHVVDPDVDIIGEIGPGQVIADSLLSVAGLGLGHSLTADQAAALSREEVASIVGEGIRFEAVLGAAFNLQISKEPDLTDPRVVYALHELGEETRHSRLFVRLLGQLRPEAVNPLERGVLGAVKHWTIRTLLDNPALVCVLVLAGEEIPDLFQKLQAEHPESDPFLCRVSRYHRQEEARHLAFARTVLPDLWVRASWWERARIRWQAPLLIECMFDSLVHPGVYEVVGLPGWRTWWAVKKTPERLALRHAATRPVLAALVNAKAFRPGRVPRLWRRLTGEAA